jgi:NAD-dependent deacetylase
MGDTCEAGSQLRPFIVWFGEAVPKISEAAMLASQAEIFLIVGTSLAVYPAAGLVHEVTPGVPVYIIDPGSPAFTQRDPFTFIREKATTGMRTLLQKYL